MTPIGGFFELELPAGCRPWHTAALPLTSGRACLRRILEIAKPARVLAPFYICDSGLEPFQALGIPVEFYPLTASLEPDVRGWPKDAHVLYVNYFDIKSAAAARIAQALGPLAIIDDTQAFFRRGRDGSWSFNSARKFFGVPDGGYAYGRGVADNPPSKRREAVRFEHLGNRLLGRQDVAYRQYLEAEADVSADIVKPSVMSERLLGGIAYDEAKNARRRNYSAAHARLADTNALRADFVLDTDAAPMCYPFLPRTGSFHDALWDRQIFAARLWPDVLSRKDEGFPFERDLAARLLPLPIDHRYTEADVTRMCDAVLEIAR